MINGLFHQWLDEARNHWQHALALSLAVRSMFPLPELLRMGLVVLVTAVLTSQVTVARLDERINALGTLREQQIKSRDAQMTEIKEAIGDMRKAIFDLQLQQAGRGK